MTLYPDLTSDALTRSVNISRRPSTSAGPESAPMSSISTSELGPSLPSSSSLSDSASRARASSRASAAVRLLSAARRAASACCSSASQSTNRVSSGLCSPAPVLPVPLRTARLAPSASSWRSSDRAATAKLAPYAESPKPKTAKRVRARHAPERGDCASKCSQSDHPRAPSGREALDPVATIKSSKVSMPPLDPSRASSGSTRHMSSTVTAQPPPASTDAARSAHWAAVCVFVAK
mmetsp:Transcript_3887/g.12580  ORF Transcript_3887/g.12580 Transcript_3887/m.12580 type:complete len:235 (-) Transcript_3887:266-970(-)